MTTLPKQMLRDQQLTSLLTFAPPLHTAPLSSGRKRNSSSRGQLGNVHPHLHSVAGRSVRTHVRGKQCVARAAETQSAPAAETLTLTVGGRELVLETGEIGRQANGAVMIRDGETMLYTTACCAQQGGDQAGFAPFSVTYSERFSAIGRTSGSYFKREGRPNINEMIISRLTDRPLRPMLPKGWAVDTQVLSWLMSFDGQHHPEPLAITSAGAALAISDIPLSKAVAGVRVGLVDGEFLVNPTIEQQSRSPLDLVIAGTADAILMIEGFCDFLSEEQMLEALRVGSEAISDICVQINEWAAKIGKPKRTDIIEQDTTLDALLAGSEFAAEVRNIYLTKLGKHERGEALGEIFARASAWLAQETSTAPSSSDDSEELEIPDGAHRALKRLEANIMRDLILKDGVRADGRSVTEVRPISSRCGLLPRTHGSVLFTRGETQAIAVTTLGSSDMAMKQDVVGVEDDSPRRFYLQYNFPPSSVGETGRVGAPGRREVGHGMLAERALAPIIPEEADFPYTIRVESTITESNGSSSMASVCGGCISLQDAGVPIKHQVAGVAMGLILADDGYRILTDILGSEDALGDMDFKVAGNATGISAFQMDIKVEGISLEIMEEALAQAKAGRLHVLQEMEKCNPPPRREFGPYTPRLDRITVHASEIGMVIGPGGKTIRMLRDESGCEIQLVDELDDTGIFEIAGTTTEGLESAKELIRRLLEEPEVGKIYRNVKVAGIEKFGLFVEFLPGKSGLVHVSELLADEDLNDFDLHDEIDVILLAIDREKFKLSRRLDGSVDADYEPPPRPAPGTICRNAKIIEVKPYGVFVEVQPGFSGLVHQSELWLDNEDRRSLNVGDGIDVLILEPRPDGKQPFSRRQAYKNGAAAAA